MRNKSNPLTDRVSVIVDGNAFQMHVEPSGGYIVGYPVDAHGMIDLDEGFELDSRAFKDFDTYNKFREAIRFLLTYERV